VKYFLLTGNVILEGSKANNKISWVLFNGRNEKVSAFFTEINS